MRLTKRQLKKIILEEYTKLVNQGLIHEADEDEDEDKKEDEEEKAEAVSESRRRRSKRLIQERRNRARIRTIIRKHTSSNE